MKRKLGRNQEAMLSCLRTSGPWYLHCGWYWDNASGTLRLLDSLVRRGLVRKTRERPRGYRHDTDVYRIVTNKPA